VLRVHFTDEDLQRVRIARAPDPLWELAYSVRRVQTREAPLIYGEWRRAAHTRLRADRAAHGALSLLRTLIPNAGYFPDFLTPAPAGPELGTALEHLLTTPQDRVAHDLVRLAESGHGTAAYAVAAQGGLRELADAMATYHQALLAPYWPQVRACVAKDLAVRVRHLLDGGTGALLHGLRPYATWTAPVLEVDYPVDRDLHLAGRGLLLIPSYFCWRRATALADPRLPPVLVVPVATEPLTAPGASPAAATDENLVRLLGRTRAAVLVEVARTDARTTSEIAEAVGVSLPSASYQIAVLRDAGLLASRRAGKFVLHTVTPLGTSLLTPHRPSTCPADQTPDL
jgi:DNA-binding transcriptional ArsR family regulator